MDIHDVFERLRTALSGRRPRSLARGRIVAALDRAPGSDPVGAMLTRYYAPLVSAAPVLCLTGRARAGLAAGILHNFACHAMLWTEGCLQLGGLDPWVRRIGAADNPDRAMAESLAALDGTPVGTLVLARGAPDALGGLTEADLAPWCTALRLDRAGRTPGEARLRDLGFRREDDLILGGHAVTLYGRTP
jgi:hypothetical protein